ncbi:MAG TPA: hypothetical protein PKM73_02005 [Verrucomicrobiota bacterium]|nr:hypothetical protein [Verrucomicrobiota bacterium]HNU50325.1 hypothetical protein [Verrucomicrobiota bacterium]
MVLPLDERIDPSTPGVDADRIAYALIQGLLEVAVGCAASRRPDVPGRQPDDQRPLARLGSWRRATGAWMRAGGRTVCVGSVPAVAVTAEHVRLGRFEFYRLDPTFERDRESASHEGLCIHPEDLWFGVTKCQRSFLRSLEGAWKVAQRMTASDSAPRPRRGPVLWRWTWGESSERSSADPMILEGNSASGAALFGFSAVCAGRVPDNRLLCCFAVSSEGAVDDIGCLTLKLEGPRHASAIDTVVVARSSDVGWAQRLVDEARGASGAVSVVAAGERASDAVRIRSSLRRGLIACCRDLSRQAEEPDALWPVLTPFDPERSPKKTGTGEGNQEDEEDRAGGKRRAPNEASARSVVFRGHSLWLVGPAGAGKGRLLKRWAAVTAQEALLELERGREDPGRAVIPLLLKARTFWERLRDVPEPTSNQVREAAIRSLRHQSLVSEPLRQWLGTEASVRVFIDRVEDLGGGELEDLLRAVKTADVPMVLACRMDAFAQRFSPSNRADGPSAAWALEPNADRELCFRSLHQKARRVSRSEGESRGLSLPQLAQLEAVADVGEQAGMPVGPMVWELDRQGALPTPRFLTVTELVLSWLRLRLDGRERGRSSERLPVLEELGWCTLRRRRMLTRDEVLSVLRSSDLASPTTVLAEFLDCGLLVERDGGPGRAMLVEIPLAGFLAGLRLARLLADQGARGEWLVRLHNSPAPGQVEQIALLKAVDHWCFDPAWAPGLLALAAQVSNPAPLIRQVSLGPDAVWDRPRLQLAIQMCAERPELLAEGVEDPLSVGQRSALAECARRVSYAALNAWRQAPSYEAHNRVASVLVPLGRLLPDFIRRAFIAELQGERGQLPWNKDAMAKLWIGVMASPAGPAVLADACSKLRHVDSWDEAAFALTLIESPATTEPLVEAFARGGLDYLRSPLCIKHSVLFAVLHLAFARAVAQPAVVEYALAVAAAIDTLVRREAEAFGIDSGKPEEHAKYLEDEKRNMQGCVLQLIQAVADAKPPAALMNRILTGLDSLAGHEDPVTRETARRAAIRLKPDAARVDRFLEQLTWKAKFLTPNVACVQGSPQWEGEYSLHRTLPEGLAPVEQLVRDPALADLQDLLFADNTNTPVGPEAARSLVGGLDGHYGAWVLSRILGQRAGPDVVEGMVQLAAAKPVHLARVIFALRNLAPERGVPAGFLLETAERHADTDPLLAIAAVRTLGGLRAPVRREAGRGPLERLFALIERNVETPLAAVSVWALRQIYGGTLSPDEADRLIRLSRQMTGREVLTEVARTLGSVAPSAVNDTVYERLLELSDRVCQDYDRFGRQALRSLGRLTATDPDHSRQLRVLENLEARMDGLPTGVQSGLLDALVFCATPLLQDRQLMERLLARAQRGTPSDDSNSVAIIIDTLLRILSRDGNYRVFAEGDRLVLKTMSDLVNDPALTRDQPGCPAD